MKPINPKLTLVCALVIGFVNQTASATVIYVDQSAVTGADDGSTFEDGFLDLQDALAIAVDGDEIRVAEGTYKPDASNVNVSFVLVDGVRLIGGYPAGGGSTPDPDTYATILSGDLAGDDWSSPVEVDT